MKTAAYVFIGILTTALIVIALNARNAEPQPEPGQLLVEEAESVMTEEAVEAGEAMMEASDTTMTPEESEESDATFTLDGFNYGYDVTEIRVKEGDTVTVTLTVSEGFHDWVVDEFDAATTKIREGSSAEVTFVADTAGTYEYYCSVGNHRAQGMVGTLIVEPRS